MAIALVSNSAPASALISATTAAIDTTGADFLIIALCCDDAHTATPTDSKSNTWTQLTSYTQTNVRVRLWYSIPTSVGTLHTFTSNGLAFVGTILAAAFSGVSTTPVDQQNGANGFSNTLQTGSITPSANGCLLWSHFGINATGVPISVNSSYTELAEQDFGAGDHYGGAFAYQIQAAAAAINPTWTRTNTNGNACTQASFLPSGGAAPTITLLRA